MSYSGKSMEIANEDVDDLKKDEILQSQANAKSALSLIQGRVKELELMESKPSEHYYRPEPIEIEVPLTNFGDNHDVANITVDSDDEDITPTLTRKSEPMIKLTKAEKKAEKRLQKKKDKATTSQSVAPDSQIDEILEYRDLTMIAAVPQVIDYLPFQPYIPTLARALEVYSQIDPEKIGYIRIIQHRADKLPTSNELGLIVACAKQYHVTLQPTLANYAQGLSAQHGGAVQEFIQFLKSINQLPEVTVTANPVKSVE